MIGHPSDKDENRDGENKPNPFGIWWWTRHLVPIILGGLFLVFGIQMMIVAYRLDNPFVFVMTFFSSSFVILISMAIAFGLIYRVIWSLRQSGKSSADPSDHEE